MGDGSEFDGCGKDSGCEKGWKGETSLGRVESTGFGSESPHLGLVRHINYPVNIVFMPEVLCNNATKTLIVQPI